MGKRIHGGFEMFNEDTLYEMHLRNFEKEQTIRNPCFFKRFPQVDFKGMNVMDLGCGLGSLTIDIAQKGVKKIIGVDIDESVINFASNYLASNYPELQQKITFQSIDFRSINDKYDIIVSKAAFEHIIDLDKLLFDMKDKLLIGGKIVTGFGPLYNSPWGDHNRLKHKLPWFHLIIPQKILINRINNTEKKNIINIQDLGLNGYSLKEFKKIFYNVEGMKVIDFRTNVSEKKSMRIFVALSKLPLLKEYFTYNIYCILEKI